MLRTKEGNSLEQKKVNGCKGSRRKGSGDGRQGGCVLTVFVAWWCIVQGKPAIAKALQEVCGNTGSGPQNYLNS